MIRNYRKRPVVIKAIQIVDEASFNEAADWIRANGTQCTTVLFPAEAFHQSSITIHTLEGNMVARTTDWVVKGTQDEFYPVQPQIFAEIYERETGKP